MRPLALLPLLLSLPSALAVCSGAKYALVPQSNPYGWNTLTNSCSAMSPGALVEGYGSGKTFELDSGYDANHGANGAYYYK